MQAQRRDRKGVAQRQRPLRIAQCNVQKSAPANTALLQLCAEEQVDIILVQEPYFTTGRRKFHNSHPAYKAHIPIDNWKDIQTQPRVITYIRKAGSLKVEQTRPWGACRGILWLQTNQYSIINIYNPPLGRERSPAITYLLNTRPAPNTLIAGD